MRINKFVARATGLSRRDSDELIKQGRIEINQQVAQLNSLVGEHDSVTKDKKVIELQPLTYMLLYKPYGFLSSRRSQGDKPTLYELIPTEYHNLQVAGRLDHDSSGLVLLTNDGDYANTLMHPRYEKSKSYKVKLDKPLTDQDLARLNSGISLDDGNSVLLVTRETDQLDVEMKEGRNRQIRRTFEALGYQVKYLHRYKFGPYQLDNLQSGHYALVDRKEL